MNAVFAAAMSDLEAAVENVEGSWSGSNLGYHSEVYYSGFRAPPQDAYFDPMWGLESVFSESSDGWHRYAHLAVLAEINSRAPAADINAVKRAANECRDDLRVVLAELDSISRPVADLESLSLLSELKEMAANAISIRADQLLGGMLPTDVPGSRDSIAIRQGILAAPHQIVRAELLAYKSIFAACRDLAELTEHTSHRILQAVTVENRGKALSGTVFIGHGRSADWRELKDFVTDRLKLIADEFNRVPSAGVSTSERLGEMLDRADIALLVMTSEDEQLDGSQRARQNVVHEAGLFQGRLGFRRALILLEEGCEEFSNIHGLGQIRYPKGRISAIFEDVRSTLEREKII